MIEEEVIYSDIIEDLYSNFVNLLKCNDFQEFLKQFILISLCQGFELNILVKK